MTGRQIQQDVAQLGHQENRQAHRGMTRWLLECGNLLTAVKVTWTLAADLRNDSGKRIKVQISAWRAIVPRCCV